MKKIFQSIIKKHEVKFRFVLIGSINTSIDFYLLFLLTSFGVVDIISNIFSTSAALIFSFFANKHFTFNDKSKDKVQFVRFTTFTLFGLWLIQPIIILTMNAILINLLDNKYLILLIGKVVATITTLFWNYILYNNFVFNQETKS